MVESEAAAGGGEEEEDGEDGGGLGLGLDLLEGWFQTKAPAAIDATSGNSTAATNARSCVAWQAASKHIPAGEEEALQQETEEEALQQETEEEKEVEEGVKGGGGERNFIFVRALLRLAGRRPEGSIAGL